MTPSTMEPAAPARCESLAIGSPRFADPELAQLAKAQGDASAWAAAFKRDGLRAPERVSGDFAVGVVDRRGRVWLAVDRFAVQSLCYRAGVDRIDYAERADRVGSTAPTASIDLDRQAIFDYLYHHAIPSPSTIFQGVCRLPPGHCAMFERGRLEVVRYWTPTFVEPSARASFDDLRHEFRALLRSAVSDRLDGGKRACFLSGGTDSSTVAGMIREATGQPPATYSIGFEAEGYDEMRYARIAARHFETEHHEHYVTPDDLVHGIPKVAGHYDQPFGNSSALPAYCCALMAHDDGATRLLAGDGGDELFGGNSRYAKQRIFDWYGRMPHGLRSGLLEPFFGNAGVGRLPGLKKGSSYVEQARVAMPDRLQMYNLLLRLGIDEVLCAGFLEQVDPARAAARQREVWSAARAPSLLDRTLAYDWRYTLAESDLPKIRGTAQLAGIDVAFPFLDPRLLEFSMRLPPSYKLRGLKLRWFFKEALRGFLPDEILTKKKQGFGLPFGVWLTRHAGLRALALDSLDTLALRGIVRGEFVSTLVQRRLQEHPGYYGEMIWILMMLEQWLRRHAPEFKA